jgi:microcystin-dependent protein
MSITDSRPPRTTPNLGLPVPGDDDAADNPTSIGDLADVLDLLAARFFVPGLIIPSARPDAPPGWLLCNGVAYPRADYDPLFQAIGTAYGPGDGATTFNVPQLSDSRFPVGAGAPGGGGGENSHALTAAEMPSHGHGVYFNSDTDYPDHAHSVSVSVSGSTDPADVNHSHDLGNGMPEMNYGGYWIVNGHGVSASGSSVRLAPIPNADNVGWVARYATGERSIYHAHSFNGSGGGGTAGADRRHAHLINGNTGAAGSSGGHNNMPLYCGVVFLIKT